MAWYTCLMPPPSYSRQPEHSPWTFRATILWRFAIIPSAPARLALPAPPAVPPRLILQRRARSYAAELPSLAEGKELGPSPIDGSHRGAHASPFPSVSVESSG